MMVGNNKRQERAADGDGSNKEGKDGKGNPLKTKYKYWRNKLFLQIHYFVSNKYFIGTIW